MKTRAGALLTALVSLLVAGLLVAAPAANADTWRHTDAARDVIVDPYDDSRPPVPRVGRGDLTRITARHDAEALQVATSVTNYCGSFWELRVTTSRGDRFVLSRGVASSEGCFTSAVRVFRNGYRFRCDGTSVQRTEAGIVARVPSSCLGSPYRVRIGVQLTTEDDYESGAQTYDDVLRTGRYTDDVPKLSPWIVRG